MELARSPIYGELADFDGRMPQWQDFVLHVRGVLSLEALSEHRTLLQDLLLIREGRPCSYDWTDASGRLPFAEVDTEELLVLERSLDSRVKSLFADAAVEVQLSSSSSWTRSGSLAVWSSDGRPMDSLHAAGVLGRGLRSACPVRRSSTRLLLPLYDTVVGGSGVFTDIAFPPFEDFERVARLCLQDLRGEEERLSIIIATSVSGALNDNGGTRAHAEVRAIVRRADRDGLMVKTATAEVVSSSPLASLPTISRAHLMALHASRQADDFILHDEFGRPREFGEGAIVWAVPGGWNAISPDLKPTINVLVRHAQCDSLGTGHLPTGAPDVFPPMYRVTPEGCVDSVSRWDSADVLVDLADKAALRRCLRLGA